MSTELPFKCFASSDDPISRWSDSNVSQPAVSVIPDTESDIVQAIQYARQNELTVIPSGGGHGSFVPITAKTLYLNLKKFSKIALDEAGQTVTIGGGVTSGQLLNTLAERGFYTVVPNSNAVGMVGFVLGGGNVSLTCNKREPS